MYKYDITYTNSKNQVIKLGRDTGIWLDENDLFSYEWKPITANGKLVAVSKDDHEKQVKLLFLNGMDDTMVNHVVEVFDYDVRMKSPGTLKVNGFERRGIIYGSTSEEYMYKPGVMYKETKFMALDDDWSRRNTFTFDVSVGSIDTQLFYPHDYPHDYGGSPAPSSFENPSPFPSEFLLRIYGPVTNPYVIINGNLYAVNCTVVSGGFLVIDSTNRNAICNYNAQGVAQNVFDYATAGAQGSGEYIYELIQPGVNQVSKSNNFKIDIEVLDSRSEPPAWKVDE